MISIIITSYKEPRTVGKAVEAVLASKFKEKREVIVAAPDAETAKVIKTYKQVAYFKDPGKGKSYALNQLFKKAKGDILVLTDGDVFFDTNTIAKLIAQFKDKKVGCVTGRPVATNKKTTMLGYFSHLLVDAGAHAIRGKLDKEGKFIEGSAYVLAMRNEVKHIPTDVAEDAIIPYLLWKKGYKVKYAPKAKVYVKFPETVKDFIKQKVRTAKAHSKLEQYAPDFPRVKGFWNEIKFGTVRALAYPRNIKEFFWTLFLFPLRLYIWIRVGIDTRVKQKEYTDAWDRVESTK